MNSLVDERVIDALYEASQAGVPVELLIRGICALRPGVPGLSETIRVRSIVGRFLEHSRVMSFDNGGDREWWLGSADLMHRNLDRRVEVLLRVCDETARDQLHEMLDDRHGTRTCAAGSSAATGPGPATGRAATTRRADARVGEAAG